ncbi:hypothetical protein D3C81_1124830 [compost metagenome]
MNKTDLIKILQEDTSPMDAEVSIYLDCTNNDCGIDGKITGVSFDKRFKQLIIEGDYEEDKY